MTNVSSLAAMDLRCAHLERPLAVDPEAVRFSWIPQFQGGRGRQSGYRIAVCRDVFDEEGPFVWDTGQRDGRTSFDVIYEGPRLEPAGSFEWAVKLWDESGSESPWSAPATFGIALDTWRGMWIGHAPRSAAMNPPEGSGPVDAIQNGQAPPSYFRRTFSVDRAIKSARLYVTALGLYEAFLNGRRIGEDRLTPGWTDYHQRVQYQAYDVTAGLLVGENALGAVLGDGWFAGYFGFRAKHAGAHYGEKPLLLAQLDVDYVDGTSRTVASDGSWQSALGGMRSADLLMGEWWSLADDPIDWSLASYDASDWGGVTTAPLDGRLLVPEPSPPIRVSEALVPVEIMRRDAETAIVDFGQNLAGWVRLRIPGGTACTIELRHGEVLNSDGSLYTENLRMARARDRIECDGSQGETSWAPRFTFHGFRYCEIVGYPGELTPEDLVAEVVHSNVPVSGEIETSDERVNRLTRNIDWGLRGNFISIPTDCPQRDERLGWLGDAQIFVGTACYQRDVAAFFSKWTADVVDAQMDNGAYTDVAPRLGLTWSGAPAWGDAGVIVPWTIFRRYGDTEVLERCYPSMRRWMDFLARDNDDHLRVNNLGNNYGDWLAPRGDATPRALLATAYWAYDASLMVEVANALGEADDAALYEATYASVRHAWRKAYLEKDARVASGTQTAYVLGLHMGLIPEDERRRAAEHLVEAIAAEDWHLSTGFVGVGYLLPVLSETGHSDVAYRLLEQDSFPSWLYTVDRGATTIWERWDGLSERGFQSPEMNSFNHYSLGSVGEWLYRYVLGIGQTASSVGFRNLVIAPQPGGSLRFARGSYRSASGFIRSGWRRDGGELRLTVEVPENVDAEIHVPSIRPEAIRATTDSRPDEVIAYAGAEETKAGLYRVGPGAYEFVSEIPPTLGMR